MLVMEKNDTLPFIVLRSAEFITVNTSFRCKCCASSIEVIPFNDRNDGLAPSSSNAPTIVVAPHDIAVDKAERFESR